MDLLLLYEQYSFEWLYTEIRALSLRFNKPKLVMYSLETL